MTYNGGSSMKIFSYSLLLAALIGVASCEPLKAQEVTIVQSLVDAYNSCADICNPWKLPERYAKFAWFVGSELSSAVVEACAKKQCNERLGYACLQSVGFVALTLTPWLLWKLCGKRAYNRQISHYIYIRETIKLHCEIALRGYMPNNEEIKKVKKLAKLCNRSSWLYLRQDSTLVSLVENFYANIGKSVTRDEICEKIKNHCEGYIK